NGLLVPPGQPAALAQAVRALLDDDDLAQRLGEAGRVSQRARAPAFEGLLLRLAGAALRGQPAIPRAPTQKLHNLLRQRRRSATLHARRAQMDGGSGHRAYDREAVLDEARAPDHAAPRTGHLAGVDEEGRLLFRPEGHEGPPFPVAIGVN